MKQLLNVVDRVIGIMLVILISVMLIVGSAQVFCRYVLHSSLSWSEELMRFLYVWIVMVGINLGIRHKSLAAITTVSDYIGKKNRAIGYVLAVGCFILQLFVCVILLYVGIQFTLANRQVSAALRIPMSYIYLAIPIGGGMGVIYTVDQIIEWYKESFQKL